MHDAPDEVVRVALPGGVWRDGDAQPLRELGLRAVGAEDEAFVFDSAGRGLPCERATALLSRCLVGEHATEAVVRKLTVGDREALLLHLRRLTFGDRMDCTLCCPVGSCGERMDVTLRVSDLLVASYGDVHRTYDIAVQAESGLYDVRFRLPTAHDLNHAAGLGRSEPERGALELLRRCILHAQIDNAAVGVDALPSAAGSAIAAAMQELDPQAELELELQCPACAAEFSIVFDTAAFFLQELDERSARLLREVHTLALYYHWSEAEILRMPARRRSQYLELVTDAQARARRTR